MDWNGTDDNNLLQMYCKGTDDNNLLYRYWWQQLAANVL